MNTRIFIGAGLALALSACGGSGGGTTDPTGTTNPTDTTDPTVADNGTFPNGIWVSTGVRDIISANPEPQDIGFPSEGGSLITFDTLISYESSRFNGDGTGETACYHGGDPLTWNVWPQTLTVSSTYSAVFTGDFETGMTRESYGNGVLREKEYYTYVGPITAESTATFKEMYSNVCDHGDH